MQKLTKTEAIEKLLLSYKRYYNITQDTSLLPFYALAEFNSHNEQFVLLKSAKIADIDSNEYVYFALQDELTENVALDLDQKAWLSGLAKVKPSSAHRNSDVTLIIIADKIEENNIEEIKRDMEKPVPMDRVLCGDVGFGKTEIAFRAIFKAISAHKQVALLCPTTLLARQHFEVALQRFSRFGIRVAILSRLIPPSIQKEYISAIENGKVDLIIGTHRLLSKEVVYKDLGLLVVDEEQRFGVEQKEKIKEMKNTVDVLSLSATPIPRTLQMSLVGIRPLSQINTAPSTRMPIQTYVTPYKEEVIFLFSQLLDFHKKSFLFL